MTCKSCGSAYEVDWRRSYRGNQDYCAACLKRWADHGYPLSGPPAPHPGVGGGPGAAGRIEDYVFLRRNGLTAAQAARRLGLTRRTLSRYNARLRETA